MTILDGNGRGHIHKSNKNEEQRQQVSQSIKKNWFSMGLVETVFSTSDVAESAPAASAVFVIVVKILSSYSTSPFVTGLLLPSRAPRSRLNTSIVLSHERSSMSDPFWRNNNKVSGNR